MTEKWNLLNFSKAKRPRTFKLIHAKEPYFKIGSYKQLYQGDKTNNYKI